MTKPIYPLFTLPQVPQTQTFYTTLVCVCMVMMHPKQAVYVLVNL
jgi:hypothetical protein